VTNTDHPAQFLSRISGGLSAKPLGVVMQLTNQFVIGISQLVLYLFL
jgi:hypothetical protein